MKRILVAFVLVCGFVACSSEYIMSTKDGRMITTDGKPKLDEDTGMYKYKDDEGRKGMVRKDDVVEILER